MGDNGKSTLLRASPTVIPVTKEYRADGDDGEGELTTIQLSPVKCSVKPRVNPEDTIRPQVLWRPGDRDRTDKGWAVGFCLAYAAFLGTCAFVFYKARPKYQHAQDGSGTKVVSDFFRDDVEDCCDEVAASGRSLARNWGLCNKLEGDSGGRRLAAGGSKFDGDEGVFDAFLEAPLIIVGCVASVALLAVLWVALLRRFAAQVVLATEALKVLLLLCLAAMTGGSTGMFAIMLAVGLGLLAQSRKNDLLKAARIISHSAVALKDNPRMIAGLVGIKLIYVLQACLFIGAFTASFEIVEVVARYMPQNRCPTGVLESANVTESESYCYLHYDPEVPDGKCHGTNCLSDEPLPPGFLEGGCVYEYPSYMRSVNQFQGLLWLWTILLVDKVRLAVVATVVGGWHFHRHEDKPTIGAAVKNAFTKSLGTLAFAATVTGAIDRLFRRRKTAAAFCWCLWIGPQICFMLPFQALLCLCGACIAEALQLFTKFAVVLHVFTGLSLTESGKKCKAIMTRHYEGGFITEYSSKSALMAGSYLFSIAVGFVAWSWVDAAFDCETLAHAMGDHAGGKFAFWMLVLWVYVFFLLCTHPVLGIILVILANSWMQRVESRRYYSGGDTTQHQWVPPLAAAFVCCVSMLLFRFMARVILDAVDAMFLCFAIDEDNGVDRRGGEGEAFGTLIRAMPEYVVASPVECVDPEQPVVRGVVERDLPPEAEVAIERRGGRDGGRRLDGFAGGRADVKVSAELAEGTPARRAGADADEELAAAKKSAMK